MKELSSSSTKTAKLPKLVISRFGCSFTEWPKFWGHFTEAINKSSIAAITKFTYLLELLEPNVKRSVESLPFTLEGYNRAKTILETKYGKESEIEKCFVKEILDLPDISGADPHKIEEFCKKLTHSVQALETMGKLNNVKCNVSMTLDTLGNTGRFSADLGLCAINRSLKPVGKKKPCYTFPKESGGIQMQKAFQCPK